MKRGASPFVASQANDDFDEEACMAEIKKYKEEEQLIRKNLEKRQKRDMNKKTLKFVVDMLNLIFGRGEETEYFWD